MRGPYISYISSIYPKNSFPVQLSTYHHFLYPPIKNQQFQGKLHSRGDKVAQSLPMMITIVISIGWWSFAEIFYAI